MSCAQAFSGNLTLSDVAWFQFKDKAEVKARDAAGLHADSAVNSFLWSASAMDEHTVWTWTVLFLAIVPWITYGVMVIIFTLSIIYGWARDGGFIITWL